MAHVGTTGGADNFLFERLRATADWQSRCALVELPRLACEAFLGSRLDSLRASE